MTERVRLSRAKGWRMPENAVKVDRSTKWGNPYVVGEHGTAADCVYAYRAMLSGYLRVVPAPPIETQQAYRAMLGRDYRELAGKRLACWCREGQPCHADALAEAVEILCRGEET